MSRKTMIEELDLVALLTDRPALNLRRGDVGTVVHIYHTGDLYEVEFINHTGGPAKGETIGVETLTADEIRPVDLGRVILHYNEPDAAPLENVAADTHHRNR